MTQRLAGRRAAAAALCALALAPGLGRSEERPAHPSWAFGSLEGSPDRGWSIDGRAVTGDPDLLAAHAGRRVGVFGPGDAKAIEARRVVRIGPPEDDLVIEGTVALPPGLGEGTEQRLRAGVLRQPGQGRAQPGDPADHLVVAEVGEDGSFTLTLPTLEEATGFAYRLIAWFDRDDDRVLDAAEVSTPLTGADDRRNLSSMQGAWMTDGFVPMGVRSPWQTELTFRPTRHLLGRVLGPDGAPLQGSVELHVEPTDDEAPRRATVPLDAEGRFHLELFGWSHPPEAVVIRAPGYAPWRCTPDQDHPPLEPLELEVRLAPE